MLRITEANRKWWVLVTMTGSLTMILIDQTVVSVALPTIQRDLDFSQTELQWVVNAYLLAIAALVALTGRIGEIIGQDRAFKLGVIVFTVSSAACGLAQSDAWLISARAVEGMGAALMIPATQAIVTSTFDVSERGRAMGIYAGISMVGLAIGPLVGGVLTESVTWRAVFWINVPVGVGIVALSLLTLRREKPGEGGIDWAGAATLVPGLTAVVLALMQSRSWGWGSIQTLGLLAFGGVALVAFALVETRVRRALVDLRLFAIRSFTGNSVVLLCVQFVLMGVSVFGSIWIQNVLGFSPITAGLALLPVTAALVVVSPQAGRLYDRLGPRTLVVAGCLLTAAAIGYLGAVLDKESYAWIVPAYLALGVGIGLVMTPTNTDAMTVAPPQERGEASGVIQTVRQIGGTIGIAVLGAIVAGVQSSKLDDFVASEPQASPEQKAQIEQVLSEGESTQQAATEQISPQVLEAAQDALTSGVSWAYYAGAIVLAVGALVALLTLRSTAPQEGGAEPGPAVA